MEFRSSEDPGDSISDSDDFDSVELEKSNVLMMGPTGSGLSLSPSHFVSNGLLMRQILLMFKSKMQ